MEYKYTIKQLADALGVSHDTVWRLVKKKKVKVLPRGIFAKNTSPLFISQAEYDRVIKQVRQAGTK